MWWALSGVFWGPLGGQLGLVVGADGGGEGDDEGDGELGLVAAVASWETLFTTAVALAAASATAKGI